MIMLYFLYCRIDVNHIFPRGKGIMIILYFLYCRIDVNHIFLISS